MDIVLKNVENKELYFNGAFIVPENVTEIGERACQYLKDLRSVFISKNLKKIRKLAFYGCKRLETVVLPNEVEYIGVYAFANCPSLKSVVVPESCEIAPDAFDPECEVKRVAEKNNGRGGLGD